MAAILGLRLAMSTVQALDMNIASVFFWSDSMNVIWWISRQSRIYQPFVANRIGEIQSATQPSQWHYVPTDQNPADMVSRGAKISELNCDMWLTGPEFLKFTEDECPKTPIQRQNNAVREVKQKFRDVEPECLTFLTSFQFEGNKRLVPDRFSTCKRLVYVCGWTMRFINNCRLPKHERMAGELTRDEIIDIEYQIFKRSQMQAFAEEYRALKGNNQVSQKSRLMMLNPQLDENGVMRSNGRLVQGDLLPFEMRHPIILPRKHAVTKLIVLDQHERHHHVGGTNHTLAGLSQRFWIIAGREAVREYESTCTKCKLKKVRAANQMMAPLPRCRITMPASLRAFTHVALDYAGPFETMRGRGKAREKRYLCLFTCMHTRAVGVRAGYGFVPASSTTIY